MAKKTTKKTTKKKTPAKKKSPAQTSRATASKKTTKKKTAKSAAKKSSKKTVKKKTAKTAAKASSKKTVKKKTASTTPKKSTSKTTAKKSAAKASSTKKTSKKAVAPKPSKAAANSSKKSTTKKSTTKKGATKKKSSGGRRSGRSVAEVASGADLDSQGYVNINGRRVRMITTTGKIKPKRSKVTTKVVEDDTSKVKKKVIKTTLTRKELTYYRKLLLAKRAELAGDLSSLESEALRSGGNLSHMPIHMADIGSDTYEQDLQLGLAESERGRLREIDEALARIANSTYGVCQMTGEQIPLARLEAKPWAKYTIEAARKQEQGWSG